MQPILPPHGNAAADKAFSTRSILDAVTDGRELATDEALHLLQLSHPDERHQLQEAAEEVRKRQVGQAVSYHAGCSLFLTNLCELAPVIYDYPKKAGDAGVFILTIDEIDARLEQFMRQTNDEGGYLTVSGGGFWSALQVPGLEKPTVLKTYAHLLNHIRERYAQLRITGFSPDEVDFLSVVSDRAPGYILELLQDHGLCLLGSHHVGILVDPVRQKISPKLTTVKHWFEIVETAARLNLPVSLKIEMGHFENAPHRIAHLEQVRDFLKRHPETFLKLSPQWVGKSGSHQEQLQFSAVSRLFLGEHLPAQQSFWQPDLAEHAQECLQWGATALGGTDVLAYPSFVMGTGPRAWMASEFTTADFQRLITETGREPAFDKGM